jgi:hypothetical protein
LWSSLQRLMLSRGAVASMAGGMSVGTTVS